MDDKDSQPAIGPDEATVKLKEKVALEKALK